AGASPAAIAPAARLASHQCRTRVLEAAARTAPALVAEPAPGEPGQNPQQYPERQRPPADHGSGHDTGMRVAGGFGERHPQLQVAGAGRGAAGAAEQVTGEQGPLGERQLPLQLGVDAADPFLVGCHITSYSNL